MNQGECGPTLLQVWVSDPIEGIYIYISMYFGGKHACDVFKRDAAHNDD